MAHPVVAVLVSACEQYVPEADLQRALKSRWLVDSWTHFLAAAVPSYRVIDTIRRIAVAEPHEETPLYLQAFGPPSAHPGVGVRQLDQPLTEPVLDAFLATLNGRLTNREQDSVNQMVNRVKAQIAAHSQLIANAESIVSERGDQTKETGGKDASVTKFELANILCAVPRNATILKDRVVHSSNILVNCLFRFCDGRWTLTRKKSKFFFQNCPLCL